MASISDVAAFVEFDSKLRRAAGRRRNLLHKRASYTHSLFEAPRERMEAQAERVKPHRIARTMARTLFAKGLVEGVADMPSIISTQSGRLECSWRKPSVASILSCPADSGPVQVPVLAEKACRRDLDTWCDDAETTASESESLVCSDAESQVPEGSPACGDKADVTSCDRANDCDEPEVRESAETSVLATTVEHKTMQEIEPEMQVAAPVELVAACREASPVECEDRSSNARPQAAVEAVELGSDWEVVEAIEVTAALAEWNILMDDGEVM